MKTDAYDYVVVGGGSAGCAVAARLSEDPNVSVLLLEAGPWDRSILVHMPIGMAVIKDDPRYNWRFPTEPEPHLDGRTDIFHRGRVMGGSSSINGMVFIRGNPLDFDGWAGTTGFPEWSYANCLAYFRKMETSDKVGSPYRGDSGPLHVETAPGDHPLHQAFLAAGADAGYGITEDVNGARQEGFFRIDWTIKGGRRWSAASAYIHPARARTNLKIRTGAQVLKILFEGRRAIGVSMDESGAVKTARASREVILSAGVIGSPHILMLSGAGDADALKAAGIPPVANLKGVGRNMQDHVGVYVRFACTEPITLARWTHPLARAYLGAQWILAKTGVGASNHFETGAFLRAGAANYANIQFQFAPFGGTYHTVRQTRTHGFQAKVTVQRPESRGSVTLASADPRERPRILFNYLATERDRAELREGVRALRAVFATRAFDRFRGPEIGLGAGAESDAELDAYARAEAVTDFHGCATCRMGPETDPGSVVGRGGLVHGLEGLRVADASIYPDVVTGNLNASAIMIGERIADAVRGRALPPGAPGAG